MPPGLELQVGNQRPRIGLCSLSWHYLKPKVVWSSPRWRSGTRLRMAWVNDRDWGTNRHRQRDGAQVAGCRGLPFAFGLFACTMTADADQHLKAHAHAGKHTRRYAHTPHRSEGSRETNGLEWMCGQMAGTRHAPCARNLAWASLREPAAQSQPTATTVPENTTRHCRSQSRRVPGQSRLMEGSVSSKTAKTSPTSQLQLPRGSPSACPAEETSGASYASQHNVQPTGSWRLICLY